MPVTSGSSHFKLFKSILKINLKFKALIAVSKVTGLTPLHLRLPPFFCGCPSVWNFLPHNLWDPDIDTDIHVQHQFLLKMLVHLVYYTCCDNVLYKLTTFSSYTLLLLIIINDSRPIYPAVSKAPRTGCRPNDCPNRWVFKRHLKMASNGTETMSAGRSFQTRGATAPKARSPIVRSRVRRTSSFWVVLLSITKYYYWVLLRV